MQSSEAFRELRHRLHVGVLEAVTDHPANCPLDVSAWHSGSLRSAAQHPVGLEGPRSKVWWDARVRNVASELRGEQLGQADGFGKRVLTGPTLVITVAPGAWGGVGLEGVGWGWETRMGGARALSVHRPSVAHGEGLRIVDQVQELG